MLCMHEVVEEGCSGTRLLRGSSFLVFFILRWGGGGARKGEGGSCEEGESSTAGFASWNIFGC